MAQVNEKKSEVTSLLIDIMDRIGIDTPSNLDEISDFVFEDVCETADPDNWHSGDVEIAFRRWIEAQAMSDTGMSDSKGNRIHVSDTLTDDGAIFKPVRMICSNGLVDSKGKTIMYGDTIDNVQQLRHIMSDLDDCDQLTLVTCDEDGDEQDHYPMAIDVIEGIRLTDDTIVREVQFIQRPNSEPDTRDKGELVDAVITQLMDDYYHGDQTVLAELLERLPWEILKSSLPEDQWKDFDSREVLIEKVMHKCYADDDPKNDSTNRAYLETLNDDELKDKL